MIGLASHCVQGPWGSGLKEGDFKGTSVSELGHSHFQSARGLTAFQV